MRRTLVAVMVAVVMAALVCVVLSGCPQPTMQGVQDVTAAQLQAMMADGQPLLIIDVRTAEEYAGGHIEGAENLPLDELATWAPTLDPSARICVVCQGGTRSAAAAGQLVERGFSGVHNLLGGVAGWPGELVS